MTRFRPAKDDRGTGSSSSSDSDSCGTSGGGVGFATTGLTAGDGFGAKKLEMDCCFVFWEELDEKGLLFGAIAGNSDVVGRVEVGGKARCLRVENDASEL